MRSLNTTRIVFFSLLALGATSAGPGSVANARVPATNKLALLVGIDDYKYDSITDLKGAVNDVHNIKQLLVESFGWPDDEAHIRVLTNSEATHDNIVKSFENHLIANADSDTIVVFQYSGHGSQMPDANGDELDKLDETLVPHDSGREKHPNRDITDDQLHDLMKRLNEKTNHVTFIFDSCHSGSATRGAGLTRFAPPDDRPVEAAGTRGGSGEAGDGGMRSSTAKYALISGARDKELAREKVVDGKSFGAMTWFFADEVRQATKAKQDVSYKDIMDRVKSRVTSEFGSQHPQLEGKGANDLVFGDRSKPAKNYVLVTTAKGGAFKINAGQIHGATVGSIYHVYTDTDFDKPSDVHVEVTKVDVMESTVKVIQGTVVDNQSKAVEREHRYDAKILVYFEDLAKSEKLQEVRKDLMAFKHIAEATEPLGYDLLIAQRDQFIVTEGAEPSEISPRVRVDDAKIVEKVRNQVTGWAKWLNVLRLQNRHRKLDFEVTLKPMSGQSRGTSSFQNRTAEIVFVDEEPFDVVIKNTSKQAQTIYVAVLDLGSNGEVTLLYPDPEQGEVQEPLAVGSEKTVELEATASSARDVLKVIATTQPCDFSFLQSPAVRDGQAPAGKRGNTGNPLEDLLANAALGTRTKRREVTAWTCRDVVFETRKK